MKYQSIKKQLFIKCEAYIQERISSIQDTLSALSESKNSETKSSAGDKYETGRAMIQLEENKNRTQLGQALALKHALASISIEKVNTKGELGSLIITNQFNYFLSVGVGKITLENATYFCVSPGSPIGLKLLGKKKGGSS